MPTALRVGLPSLVPQHLLAAFPPQAQLQLIEPFDEDPVRVEFLLAPWPVKEAAAVLGRAEGVRWVQSFAAGIEGLLPHIPPGATLLDAQGLHDAPTAEWAVTAILASLKRFPFYAALQREGRWNTRALSDVEHNAVHGHGAAEQSAIPILVEELYAKRVLIVGYGSIGRAIEARLAPFEVEITRVARSAKPGVHAVAELHALLPQTDVLVIITPLTPETRHLVGAAELALLPQGALVVNAARGGVVDTAALVDALNERRVRAALDVTDPEPLPAGHPLWTAPNLLLTPHVAGSSPVFLQRVIGFAAQQVERILAGQEPVNIVSGAY